MASDWSEGYFTDVGYTYGYYAEINPVFQRFCLLLRGFAPLQSTGGHHCELGFGQGVSFALHAAANPGKYVGTDFNPVHAAHAASLVAASGADARVYDDSFEQLLQRDDLPAFDSISLHGIWTWVSRDNHRTITEFARRHLRPGGTFYVSYNCFPGWSPAYPLRQLFSMYDHYSQPQGGALSRVDAALAFADNLLKAQPLYAQAVPQLAGRLEQIRKQDRHYLAHEYLNRDWNCMYFTDVVDTLSDAKLDYACTAVPMDAVDAVNLSDEALAFLGDIQHPVLREQARDYFVNQQFRKDIYLRGAARLSPVEQRSRLLDTRFALKCVPSVVPQTINTPRGEATLQPAVYGPVVQALASKQYAPKTLRELSALLPDTSFNVLLQAVTVLIGAQAATPCQSASDEKQVRARCQALNRHLIERAQYSNDVSSLASPVTGGGVGVGRFQQLFILFQLQGHKQPDDWAQQLWALLESQGQKIIKDGQTLETAEDNLAECRAQAQDFAANQMSVLKALHVF